MSTASASLRPMNTNYANQAIASSSSAVYQPSKPQNLVDVLMRLAREAFMPKEFVLSRPLKVYVKEELSKLGKLDSKATKAKTLELTAQYNAKAEQMTNDYMISQVNELWAIVKNCAGVMDTNSSTKRFRHLNPQEYVGEVGIKALMDELKKHVNKAKQSRGLLASQIVMCSNIFKYLDGMERAILGKKVYFVRDGYLDMFTKLRKLNFDKLFPQQNCYETIVSNQIDQLEAAILAGKDHTDEALPDAVAAFQVRHAANRKSCSYV